MKLSSAHPALTRRALAPLPLQRRPQLRPAQGQAGPGVSACSRPSPPPAGESTSVAPGLGGPNGSVPRIVAPLATVGVWMPKPAAPPKGPSPPAAPAPEPTPIAMPRISLPKGPTLPSADLSISHVARILVAVFALTVFYGSMLSALLSWSPLPVLGGLVLGGLLLFSSLKPLRASHPDEPSKMLAAVLGYLGFSSASSLLSGSAAPVFGLPPFLVAVFCVASYIVFLHPAKFYKAV